MRSAACFTAVCTHHSPTRWFLVLGPRQTATATVTVARPANPPCHWSAALQMRKRDDHLRPPACARTSAQQSMRLAAQSPSSAAICTVSALPLPRGRRAWRCSALDWQRCLCCCAHRTMGNPAYLVDLSHRSVASVPCVPRRAEPIDPRPQPSCARAALECRKYLPASQSAEWTHRNVLDERARPTRLTSGRALIISMCRCAPTRIPRTAIETLSSSGSGISHLIGVVSHHRGCGQCHPSLGMRLPRRTHLLCWTTTMQSYLGWEWAAAAVSNLTDACSSITPGWLDGSWMRSRCRGPNLQGVSRFRCSCLCPALACF